MIATPDIILESGGWRARVLAQAGGLLGSLDCDGVPILRPMSQGSVSQLDAACFPMVPWCNRIADGRFGWTNTIVALTRNFPPERHAIHGHGWQSQWALESVGADHCTLVHCHDGAAPGWPWAYAARQAIRLSEEGCAITLSITNQSGRMMPVGLGLHPYLRRRPESRVRFHTAGLCELGCDMIPTGRLLAPHSFGDFSADGGGALPADTIDHCYAGWDGTAVVTDDLGTITLQADGAAHLHVYAPQQADVLCLEPVSHLPDAANTGTMPLCAPDETIGLTLRIGVSAP